MLESLTHNMQQLLGQGCRAVINKKPIKPVSTRPSWFCKHQHLQNWLYWAWQTCVGVLLSPEDQHKTGEYSGYVMDNLFNFLKKES